MHMPDSSDTTADSDPLLIETLRSEGYERRDVRIKGLLIFFAVVGIALVVLQFGLWELLRWLRADAISRSAPRSPLASEVALPPEPRLQNQPLNDYARLLHSQNERLKHYGWIDRGQQRVHIPISRALDLIAGRGLPVNSQPPAADKVEHPQKSKAVTK